MAEATLADGTMKDAMAVDALVIGAHPDDAELQAGGTLLRLRSLGYRTGILVLTRGERASRGSPEQRAREAAAAATALGVQVHRLLDFGDTCLRDAPELRHALVRALRQLRPRLVFTHHPDEPHPDHGATALAAAAAVHLAGLAGVVTEHPPHRPHGLLRFALLGHRTASLVVDISPWADRKHAALRLHRSQFQTTAGPATQLSSPSFLEDLVVRERYCGSLIGCERGEAFMVDRMIAVEDPFRAFPAPVTHFSG